LKSESSAYNREFFEIRIISQQIQKCQQQKIGKNGKLKFENKTCLRAQNNSTLLEKKCEITGEIEASSDPF